MIRSSCIAMLLVCAVCSFCGKDFVTLGRHSWRCKQRVNQEEQSDSESPITREVPVVNSPTVVILFTYSRFCWVFFGVFFQVQFLRKV
jgi:predicted amidophosphoribosyltransferase